jgi:hypothetical protein
MNVAQEIELESSDYAESPELVLRMECLERRLLSLEGWLGEVASDMLDRFAVISLDAECETERIGS